MDSLKSNSRLTKAPARPDDQGRNKEKKWRRVGKHLILRGYCLKILQGPFTGMLRSCQQTSRNGDGMHVRCLRSTRWLCAALLTEALQWRRFFPIHQRDTVAYPLDGMRYDSLPCLPGHRTPQARRAWARLAAHHGYATPQASQGRGDHRQHLCVPDLRNVLDLSRPEGRSGARLATVT